MMNFCQLSMSFQKILAYDSILDDKILIKYC